MENRNTFDVKLKMQFKIPQHYMSLAKKSLFGQGDLLQTKSILRQNQERIKTELKSQLKSSNKSKAFMNQRKINKSVDIYNKKIDKFATCMHQKEYKINQLTNFMIPLKSSQKNMQKVEEIKKETESPQDKTSLWKLPPPSNFRQEVNKETIENKSNFLFMLSYLKSKKTAKVGDDIKNYEDSAYGSSKPTTSLRQNFFNRSIRVTRNCSKVMETPQKHIEVNKEKRSRSTGLGSFRSKTSHLKTRSLQLNTCVKNDNESHRDVRRKLNI